MFAVYILYADEGPSCDDADGQDLEMAILDLSSSSDDDESDTSPHIQTSPPPSIRANYPLLPPPRTEAKGEGVEPPSRGTGRREKAPGERLGTAGGLQRGREAS